jgi:GT2 family glycosyltransferase
VKISYIICTFNKPGVLKRHLDMLLKQTLSHDLFEVIVVNDGEPIDWLYTYSNHLRGFPVYVYESKGKGPAGARNMGAGLSSGPAILFSQDDALPHPHLLFRHWLRHYESTDSVGVQGFTDWHQPRELELFLYESGLQANWSSLKNPDGSWKQDATGFCLTTNFSIAKSEFERLGGFSETFPHAAWEDVEFGLRGQKHGLKTLFEPNAINYHAHRQTLDSFITRQLKEGASRLILCSLHPEASGSLLDPEGLRTTTNDMLQTAITEARETHFISGVDVHKVRYDRWTNAFRLASLEGIRRGITERAKTNKVWLAIQHLHTGDECHHVVTVASRLDSGELAFAETSAEWALQQNKDNWALWAVRGEVSLAMGDRLGAVNYMQRASALGPGETWPVERLKELA